MKLFPFAVLFACVIVACSDASTGADVDASELRAGNYVSGRVVFPSGATVPAEWTTAPASGEVKLIDVTYQDGPSTDIVKAPVSAKNGAPIPFELSLAGVEIDPTHDYALVAHLDTDGDGTTSAGDFLSMESFPVLTRGRGFVADVEVRRVETTAASKVSGNVLLSGNTVGAAYPFPGVVRVLDVTFADGPSTVVGSQSIQVTGPGPLPFEVAVTGVDPTSHYVVEAHLDTDGSGAVSDGDFLTTESFPVLTHGYGSVIDVTATRL